MRKERAASSTVNRQLGWLFASPRGDGTGTAPKGLGVVSGFRRVPAFSATRSLRRPAPTPRAKMNDPPASGRAAAA